MASSLAKQIRSATDHEDIDLAGFGQSQISELFTAAFSEAIPAPKMIGFRFTVRQKYGDDMPKFCRDALRAIGFEEDRGASAIMECAGSFKYQHDTDKDLKFIHVFPKIDISASAAPAEAEEEADIKIGGMKLEELPPEHLCSIVSMETFVKLVAKQCPSFSQRRALLKAMKEMAAKIAGFEEKMSKMEQLTASEDELYNTAQDVPGKVSELEKQLEGMMTGQHLTRKKTDKLEAAMAALQAKIQGLKDATPTVRRRKEDREILTLRKQLRELKAIEDSKQVLSLDEIKKLNQKANIVTRLEQLEAETKGWFDAAIPEADRLRDPPPASKGLLPPPAPSSTQRELGWSEPRMGERDEEDKQRG
ncbi:hypothetical protein GUITHDRAFT_137444 [Guillardia theta CCMP2712]|uniref:Uncharacterized protein n=1 Tax=Guillardia theta (strain CCMP2712) TaxID=905079 RepID=L1JHX9_GUITC|nr:hypothetical protein GUITHDRAFT_137444 [Guillardia theta CCMP2712]EKX47700.1 hypothetical protein GUITHDRAFT_137444 [Guillardia theta CCMP2712]|eukprot:XP_005834680.1 hypothetical protein GUITHDRAFT_137444 [Guillardia theta CCMP2712]